MANYSVCGIDCEKCEVGHSNQCPGCKEMKGKVFWGECDLYKCNSQKNQEHCGKCAQFPCDTLKEWAASENTERIENLRNLNIIKGKCGTDCNTCQFKEQFNCGGCVKQNGEIFWGECDIFKCASEKGFNHCGECPKLPCAELTAFIENGHNPERLSNLNKWKNEDR